MLTVITLRLKCTLLSQLGQLQPVSDGGDKTKKKKIKKKTAITQALLRWHVYFLFFVGVLGQGQFSMFLSAQKLKFVCEGVFIHEISLFFLWF